MKNSVRTLGFVQIILSGFFFSFLGLFGKTAYSFGILPGELLSIRYSLSAFFTLLVVLLTNPKSLFTLSKFEIVSSLLLGIFGYALFSSLFFLALTGLSASLTVLLLYTYPIIVTLFSSIFLKEKMGSVGHFALFLVSIGLLGLVWGEWNINNPIFLLYGIGSALFYGLYIITSRKFLSKTPALPSSFFVQLGAGSILSLLNFKNNPTKFFTLFTEHYVLLISMAIVCSLLAMSLFLAGLQKIKASEAAILSTTEPIFGVLIASIFLGEKLQTIQLAGGALILGGLILITRRKT